MSRRRMLGLITGLTALLTPAACSAGHAPTHGSGTTASASTTASAGPATSSPSISDGEADRLPTVPGATGSPDLPTPTSTADVQRYASTVFTDAQRVWRNAFSAAGLSYTPARLVLFSSAVTTGCGPQSSAVGPFYCPADHTVYLDVLFFDQLERSYGLKGDFAMAYVVAHELGHHIQAITGLSTQVAAAQQRDPAQANALSVRVELQADCYAGVWAYSTYARGLLQPGDLDAALAAAATVGDDFLQRSAGATVNPEQWTHGSSAQRQQWLSTGYESGQPAACNTFAGF